MMMKMDKNVCHIHKLKEKERGQLGHEKREISREMTSQQDSIRSGLSTTNTESY